MILQSYFKGWKHFGVAVASGQDLYMKSGSRREG